MKRKLIWFLLVFSLLTVFFLCYLKFAVPNNKDSLLLRLKIELFDENEVIVLTDEAKMQTDVIKITWQGDFVEERVIWEHGKKVGVIPNEYGPQGFTVFYNNEQIGSIGLMKTNSWHTHNYMFKLKFIDANYTIGFDFTAQGPNSVSYKNIH